MLSQLTIKNYAIVDHLDLELKAGMSVITGETGAGKSIMLDALALTLGDRADKDVVQAGKAKADISASFLIGAIPEARAWLDAQDYGVDGDDCILRRVVTAEGRSKAYINGHPVTLNELRQLGEMLVDIHSQHEHQSLLKSATHQRLLDEFCGVKALADEVRETALKWQQVSRKLEELRERSEEHNARFDLLTYQLKELDDLNLGATDLAALEEEHQQLSHAGAFLESSQAALDLCKTNEEQNIVSALNHALALLDGIPYRDKALDNTVELLSTALIQVEEAATELGRAIDSFDASPERMRELDTLMGELHHLARKHKVAAHDLPEIHESLRQQLAGMSAADDEIEALSATIEQVLADYRRQAGKLSKARREGAARLADRVNEQLRKLDMSSAHFTVELTANDEDKPSGKGLEAIEFLVSTNPGQPPKPLIKIASGGELSRISLAIQVVTAQTSAIPSLIFDEVDVGIGGGVAKAVGELLRQLGEKGQVLCVTHQPQVASQGHQHYFVSKSTAKNAASTRVVELSHEERIEEIARMLAGDDLSASSLAHARQMMA